jgi:hypothetical protein
MPLKRGKEPKRIAGDSVEVSADWIENKKGLMSRAHQASRVISVRLVRAYDR